MAGVGVAVGPGSDTSVAGDGPEVRQIGEVLVQGETPPPVIAQGLSPDEQLAQQERDNRSTLRSYLSAAMDDLRAVDPSQNDSFWSVHYTGEYGILLSQPGDRVTGTWNGNVKEISIGQNGQQELIVGIEFLGTDGKTLFTLTESGGGGFILKREWLDERVSNGQVKNATWAVSSAGALTNANNNYGAESNLNLNRQLEMMLQAIRKVTADARSQDSSVVSNASGSMPELQAGTVSKAVASRLGEEPASGGAAAEAPSAPSAVDPSQAKWNERLDFASDITRGVAGLAGYAQGTNQGWSINVGSTRYVVMSSKNGVIQLARQETSSETGVVYTFNPDSPDSNPLYTVQQSNLDGTGVQPPYLVSSEGKIYAPTGKPRDNFSTDSNSLDTVMADMRSILQEVQGGGQPIQNPGVFDSTILAPLLKRLPQ